MALYQRLLVLSRRNIGSSRGEGALGMCRLGALLVGLLGNAS